MRADIVYKQGQQFDNQRQWTLSIDLYRRALAARTTEDHYMLFLGRSLLEQAKQAPDEGTFQLGASPDFEDILALEPIHIGAMNKVELLRAAEVVLTRAQEVNPLNTDHTANLARLYRTWADLIGDGDERAKQLDSSSEAYEMAVTLSPNAAHLWNERGNAFLASNDRDLALKAYEHSLSIDPLYDQTYLLLADFYNREQSFEKIVEILSVGVEAMTESRRHNPSVQTLSFLALAYARTDQLDEAVATYERVIDIRPNDVGTIRNIAVIYRDKGEYEKTIEWAERGVTLLPADQPEQIVQFRQLLVEANQQLGNTEQIIEQLELLLQVAPNTPQFLQQLYSLYQAQGQSDKLIGILPSLINAVPANYEYPFALARLLLEDGQTEQANQYATQALQLAPAEQKSAVEELISTINSGS